MTQRRHAPETVAKAREMYRQGLRTADICAATGMPLSTLYYYLDGGPQCARIQPLPRRRVVIPRLPGVARRSPTGFAGRLKRTAARAAQDIAARLADPAQKPAVRESDLRSLAVLARMLRDISAFEAHSVPPPARPPTQEELAEHHSKWLLSRAEDLGARAEALEAQVLAATSPAPRW
jgi:AcrR family transcriptional regulator